MLLQNQGLLVFLVLVYCLNPQLSFSSSSTSNSTHHTPFLCLPHQTHALLLFKSNFVIAPSASFSCDESSPKIESWKEDTDCCYSWDGVTCDEVTGHVIGLDLSCSQLQGTIDSNSSLFSSHIAPYLQRLDLACNNFEGVKMPSEFGVKFGSSLTHLNLSQCSFTGNIPSEISNLSNLVSLDLSSFGLTVESDRLMERIAHNLTHLKILNLDFLDMSSVHASSLMNLSSSLTSLLLFDCRLQGEFPTNLLLRPNLQLLDLAYNNFSFITSLPHFNSTATPSNSLKVLSLDQVDLSAIGFLELVGNYLVSLRRLYLRDCNIRGSIPQSFGNLTKLVVLDLGLNNLSGAIPPSLGYFNELTDLFLDENHLIGPIPTSFSNLFHLANLVMSDNELEGPLPSYLFALPSLVIVQLQNNKLHDQIQTSPVESVRLTRLDLSNNNLSGSLDFDVFLKFKKLEYLNLSTNHISSSTSIDTNLDHSLPSFDALDLSGCNLTQFPAFIKALTNLTYLSVSNNQIQGSVPEWMHDVGKYTLSSIDLSSNLLQGPLPIPPANTRFFLVSNNALSGEISSLVCNASPLTILDLSHNRLSGSMPRCLGSLGSLEMLNLGANNLHGVIPDTFAKDCSLDSLVLNANQLSGTLPRSLAYCQNLQILDVGNNMVEGTVPPWLGTFLGLRVLVLRSNKLYGSLNNFKAKPLFPLLRILDLSNNNFTGRLPIELLNATARVVDEQLGDKIYGSQYIKSTSYDNFYYSVVITVKGIDLEYVKVLNIFATIDLSRNKFEGHIPEVTGKLVWLRGLNLSHNLFTGRIPSSIGDWDSIEWLDLSSNRLSGHIPGELVDLRFLAVLNLSHNQLGGPIPQGMQFNTFGNDSYDDNLALCGFPLSKECMPNHKPPNTASEDGDSSNSGSGFSWEGAFAGYGCGIVFGLFMGYLAFRTRSPKWFVRMVERKKRNGTVTKRSKKRVRTTLYMYR